MPTLQPCAQAMICLPRALVNCFFNGEVRTPEVGLRLEFGRGWIGCVVLVGSIVAVER